MVPAELRVGLVAVVVDHVTIAIVGKGDHDIWFSPITQISFVVDSKIKSRHTANAVLKQAGLPKKF